MRSLLLISMLGGLLKVRPRDARPLIKLNPPRGGLAVKICVLRLCGRLHWLVDDLIKLVQLGLAFEGNVQGCALLALDPVPSLASPIFDRLDFWSLHRRISYFLLSPCGMRNDSC